MCKELWSNLNNEKQHRRHNGWLGASKSSVKYSINIVNDQQGTSEPSDRRDMKT